jgi:putative membrane protein insertion efficiency factor
MKRIAKLFIKGYQLFSSTREPRCKYYPSCSNYAATAINRYGFKGLWMSIWRVLRCNPWSEGGLDYVDYQLDSADALAKARHTMVSSTAMEGVN